MDPNDIQDAIDEACVDAYDEHEQHSGLVTMIEEQLEFPFPAKVLGDKVQVVGAEWPEGDRLGLDLVCERNGDRHRIEARNVELLTPLPDGHLYLAAYLDWKSRI